MYNDPNDPHRYDDLLPLPHQAAAHRRPMAREMRAAQFAPFAALTGYEEAVEETARLTDRKPDLDDDQKLLLNSKLLLLSNRRAMPLAAFTYFRPDGRKQGGQILEAAGPVKKIDVYERRILLADGQSIPIDDVLAIESELFRHMEEQEPPC